MEINPNEVYTSEETAQLLKISSSTFKRLVKQGLIRGNKIGKNYRILGKEILRLVSPEVEQKATNSYLKLKKKVIDKVQDW